MKTDKQRSRLIYITAMVIFGSAGVVRKLIPLSTPFITMVRGFFGCAGFICLMKLRRQPFTLFNNPRKLARILLAGVIMALNILTLHESFSYIPVSTSTVYYYLSPFFAILLSPLIIHEKLSRKAIICGCFATVGVVLISGRVDLSFGGEQIKGVALSLTSALLYALMILINKDTTDVPPEEKMVFELGMVLLVAGIDSLLTDKVSAADLTLKNILLLTVMGLVHTCIAHYFNLAGMRGLDAQTCAILNYITPVVTLILSNVILHETFTAGEILGTVLIIGSAFANEMPVFEKRK